MRNKTDDSVYLDRKCNTDAFNGILNPDESKGPLGIYHSIEQKSVVSAIDNSLVSCGGGCTKNPPTLLEYFIDIERVFVKCFANKGLLKLFYKYYILGNLTEPVVLDTKVLYRIIQKVGYTFRSNRLYPVKAYFTTVKR